MERSVFVSYARADSGEVHYDAELLRAGGVRVFIDVQSIGYGERWRDVLTQAIEECERVLVFWSKAAQFSEWVDREWRLALSLGKKIVPTLLDTTPLPVELTEFQCVRRFKTKVPRRRARTYDHATVSDDDTKYKDLVGYTRRPDYGRPHASHRLAWIPALVLVPVVAWVSVALWTPRAGQPTSAASVASGPASGPTGGTSSWWYFPGALLAILVLSLLLVRQINRRRSLKDLVDRVDASEDMVVLGGFDIAGPTQPTRGPSPEPDHGRREPRELKEALAFVEEVFRA